MIYVSIDTKTKDGRALATYLENLVVVQVYKEPNARTLKSIKAANAGKANKVNDVKNWYDKLIS